MMDICFNKQSLRSYIECNLDINLYNLSCNNDVMFEWTIMSFVHLLRLFGCDLDFKYKISYNLKVYEMLPAIYYIYIIIIMIIL